MSTERLPNPEGLLTKEEILAKIKESGFNDDRRREIIQWREMRELIILTEREKVALEVDMLAFYSAGGTAEDIHDDAIQTFYFARATEGCDDLVEKILGMYPYLDSTVTMEQVLDAKKRDRIT